MNKADLNGTLVKADIIDQVYEKVGFTRQEAAKAVEILFDVIKSELANGNNVEFQDLPVLFCGRKGLEMRVIRKLEK